PRGLWGKTLAESQLRRTHRLSVVLVKRQVAGEEQTLAAAPDERLREGDVLTVLACPGDLTAFHGAYPE
ncbi:MAG: TrkA C-terminal domain-containing protein, partial [Proteobacteria bacterium]|nr:TrkA C-terminal domain-containing protein [Pseudomonadota bacterium]